MYLHNKGTLILTWYQETRDISASNISPRILPTSILTLPFFHSDELMASSSTGLEHSASSVNLAKHHTEPAVYVIFIHSLKNGLFRIHMQGQLGRYVQLVLVLQVILLFMPILLYIQDVSYRTNHNGLFCWPESAWPCLWLMVWLLAGELWGEWCGKQPSMSAEERDWKMMRKPDFFNAVTIIRFNWVD